METKLSTNSGDQNSGDRNSGDQNSGDRNSGDQNSGDRNSGDRNSGDRNSGDRNSGDQNSGHCNSGSQNSGHWNSGHWNSGHRNSGNRNCGDRNSGHWNSGHWNSGHCNSDTPSIIRVFNRDCKIEDWDNAEIPNWMYFKLLIDELEWIDIADMTDQQKIDNPTFGVTEGFLLLKKSDFTKDEVYKKSAQKSWNEATHEDKMLTYQLPNFDAKVAFDIFGIDFEGYLSELTKCECSNEDEFITLNGRKYKLVD